MEIHNLKISCFITISFTFTNISVLDTLENNNITISIIAKTSKDLAAVFDLAFVKNNYFNNFYIGQSTNGQILYENEILTH